MKDTSSSKSSSRPKPSAMPPPATMCWSACGNRARNTNAGPKAKSFKSSSGRPASSSAPTSTRDGLFYVRVDGTVFSHSVLVGDPSAKGAKPNDKVVVEMLRFPTAEERGEAVIIEVLGPHGKLGVDTLSVIRALGLPDAFPEDVLEEARQVGGPLQGRRSRRAARISPIG